MIDQNVAKVLTIFSLAPGAKFRRKELKERTKLNNVNLDKALDSLQNSKIVLRDNNYFKLNLNEKTKTLIEIIQKEYKELNEIPLNVFFSILDLINRVIFLKDVKVYLFGSYAKPTFKEGSDIDLAIISGKKLDFLEKIALKIKKKYKTKIQLHFFGEDFTKHKEDPLVREITRNNIQLL
ncbi:MAG: nucleotidyltransferase domain-containing protein [Candidatus Aenigmatarchaeota archaeon]